MRRRFAVANKAKNVRKDSDVTGHGRPKTARVIELTWLGRLPMIKRPILPVRLDSELSRDSLELGKFPKGGAWKLHGTDQRIHQICIEIVLNKNE